MIKRILILAIAMIFISVTSSFALINQEETFEEIITSIETQPEMWYDSGHYFIYSSSQAKLKEVKKRLFPENHPDAEIVITYNILSGYVKNWAKLEKPFKYDFKGDLLEQLIIQIMVYKLNVLNDKVGSLIKKPKEKIIVQPEIKKEQTNKEKGWKKL